MIGRRSLVPEIVPRACSKATSSNQPLLCEKMEIQSDYCQEVPPRSVPE